MTTARTFVTLYQLVAQLAQDESSAGYTTAKAAINTIIKEINREFKIPEIFKGKADDVSVTLTAGQGIQSVNLATDISRLDSVWYKESNSYYELEQIEEQSEWIARVDGNTSGEPECFRYIGPDVAGNNVLQVWPAPNSGWISLTSGLLFYSYWAQLAQLSADGDIPNIPYELDTILVNGGVLEMARAQGDNLLIGMYKEKYEDDKGALRGWLIDQKSKDRSISPAQSVGSFGMDNQKHGYKVQ